MKATRVFLISAGALLLGMGHPQRVSAMGEVGTLTLSAGQDGVVSAVIDSSRTFAYFGTNDIPGSVVQIQLSNFTQTNANVLSSVGNLDAAVISSTTVTFAGGSAPLGSPASGIIVRLPIPALGTQSSLIVSGSTVTAAVVDPTGQFGLFGTLDSPAQITKVDLTTMATVSSLVLNTGENDLTAGVIDPAGRFAYFGTNTSPGKIIKIQLSPLAEVGALTLGVGENQVTSAVIDSTGTFAYFGTNTVPGKVVRIQLSNFTQTGSAFCALGDNNLTSAVIDSSGTFAYFGTNTSPGRVVRFNLAGMFDALSSTLAAGENLLTAATIDQGAQFAYFGANTAPGKIIKFDLNDARTGPPLIASNPSSVILLQGQSATFTVAAVGSTPLTYQWQKNGVDIPGATSSSFTTPPVDFPDDGARFHCVVTNPLGSNTSTDAILTVKPVPRVYPDPWRADKHTGINITFDHMAPNSTIKLFTLGMHWLRSIPGSAGGTATWDLTNDAGARVASGYYFYIITTSDDNQTVHGKMAIIQ